MIADGMTAIEQATGTRPAGYNNYWIRPGVNALEILQELGFTCHIDDLSADEPFPWAARSTAGRSAGSLRRAAADGR